VNRELQAYNPELADRPQIVVATKIDALDEPARLESLREQAAAAGLSFFAISSVTNKGTAELVAAIAAKLDEVNAVSQASEMIELGV
jgi:GTP-binding protein